MANKTGNTGSTGMPTLPAELWLRIAGFLPPDDLIKLIGVNRVLFQAIMDQLYDQASFISAVPRVFLEKVYALQNPDTAHRVRTLIVWPSAIRDAINNGSEHDAPSTESPPKHQPPPHGHGHRRTHSNILDRGRSYMDRLLDRKTSPPPSSSTADNLISSDERTKLFIDGIRQLSNLDELQIVWYLDKDKQREPVSWTFPHFPLIWRSVGYNLRRLSMDVQLHILSDVTSTSGSLQQLEWLELTVRRDKALSHLSGEDNAIPYFINKLAPSLRFLSLKTIGHQSLAFFDLLGTFPRLRSLALAMPLDADHLPDPTGLHRFLDDHHHNIQTLSVRYTQCCGTIRRDDGFGFGLGASEALMSPTGESVTVRHRIFSNLSLHALQSLEMGLALPPGGTQTLQSSSSSSALPPTSPHHHFNTRPSSWGTTPAPWLTSLAHIGPHLTSLILVDRCLTLDETRLVLKAFPTRGTLKKLSLYVKNLSPQLVDLVATTCGALSSLTLDVERVVKRDNVDEGDRQDGTTNTSTTQNRESDIDGFVMALYDFAIQEDEYRYARWTLSDITVLAWEFQVGKRLNWTCMRAIAGVVPTVRRFAGKEEPESVSSFHGHSQGHGYGLTRRDSGGGASMASGVSGMGMGSGEGRPRGSMDSTRSQSRSRNRQVAIYRRPGEDEGVPGVGVRQELTPLRRRLDIAPLPSRLDT